MEPALVGLTMKGNGESEVLEENEFPGQIRSKYRPVVAHDNDHAVVEMSSLEATSLSSTFPHTIPPVKVKVGKQQNMAPEEREGH